MNKELYLKNKILFQQQLKKYKSKCPQCWQPEDTCICQLVVPVDVKMSFVILTHPIEAGKRIASGRIAYSCLKNSYFFRGYDFLHKKAINDIICGDNNQCFVLYPSQRALDLSKASTAELKQQFKTHKNTFIFVIDGTWGNANKMLRLSPNIATLPKIKFNPKHPSRFRVRKQPKGYCLSSLEAINEIIDLTTAHTGIEYNKSSNPLIKAFDFIVEDQLKKIQKYKDENGGLNPRNPKYRKQNSVETSS